MGGRLVGYDDWMQGWTEEPLEDEAFIPTDLAQGGQQGAGEVFGIIGVKRAPAGAEAELDGPIQGEARVNLRIELRDADSPQGGAEMFGDDAAPGGR